MTDLTREQIEALLDGATQGPWQADGEPWNRVVWSSAENRVCFMAHSNGLDDARDIATSNLVAAAPDLARALLDARAERDRLRADAAAAVALIVERAVAPLTDEEAYSAALGYRHDLGLLPPRDQELECSCARWWHVALSHRIRALAPADGLAAVEALRVEARENAMQALASMGQAQEAYEAQLEAEAELAASRAREKGLAARREGGSPLSDETPAQHEERTCTCGAGHGSLEGHTDWCDFTAYQSLKVPAEVQARDDASTPPADTWHERRTMLPDGDARKGEGGRVMLTKEPQQTWVFDRYVNGVLMAEGVEVTRASSLEEAMIIAARLAACGPNGETPVLILCNALDALARAEKAEQERDRIDQWRETAIVERDTYSEERDAAEGRVAALTEALGDMVGLFSADNVLRKGTHMNATLKLARAALAQTPTDPGDGWTWNERLGWIGPDGKPAGRGDA